ncbi:DUF5375 family protein [Escherichia coli]|nr:DUF5375 family protein [Escherichia coli]
MKTPLPPVLRAALYRRAVACAWLTVCERQHRYPGIPDQFLSHFVSQSQYLRAHSVPAGTPVAEGVFSVSKIHSER